MNSSGQKKHIEVAVGIVLLGGRALICRRKTDRADAFAGLWEFPGGKCEDGETPEACVRRELMEELGIEVAVETPLPTVSHDYPSVSVRLHPFLCRLVSGEPRAMSAAEWRWVGCAELPTYRFPDANDGAGREQPVMEKREELVGCVHALFHGQVGAGIAQLCQEALFLLRIEERAELAVHAEAGDAEAELVRRDLR